MAQVNLYFSYLGHLGIKHSYMSVIPHIEEWITKIWISVSLNTNIIPLPLGLSANRDIKPVHRLPSKHFIFLIQ